MKLLFFQWNSFLNKGLEKGLQKLNVEYETFFYVLKNWEKDEIFSQRFEDCIGIGMYHRVFSVNFIPLISEVCQKKGIPYISWVYDSPVHIMNLDSMKNSCNTIYFFDRGQAEVYRKTGISAEHMPLAVDTRVFERNTAGIDLTQYETDISLVGKLYQTEYSYYTAPLNEYQKGYFEGIIKAQGKISGGYFIDEMITAEILESLNVIYRKVSDSKFTMGRRELEFMLACETTGRERFMALALLASHYKVDLYSVDEKKELANVTYKGYADYYMKMPLVFSVSKVNLNISLKTVRTGIPLRVLDVIGCGGFVLSNFQAEMMEYFTIGEDLIVYENQEDMFYKTKFYLEHEELRQKVIESGLKRVKQDFTFEDRIRKMGLT